MPRPVTTAKSYHAPIAIRGAGCAGLHLGLALKRAGYTAPVTLYDTRRSYHNDRSFCTFLNPAEAPPYLKHQWPFATLRHADRTLRLTPHNQVYGYISGAAFYGHALRELRPQLRLASTRTDFEAAWVFDSRPRHAPAALLQHFHGWFVEHSAPVFTPDTCTLMDFLPPSVEAVGFIYLLPFSAHRALVEATYFSPSTFPKAHYECVLRDYLAKRFPGRYRRYREEAGVLPMDARLGDPAEGKVIPIGTRAGALKPSTGYGFIFMQRHADALAAALMEGDDPSRIRPRSRWKQRIDHVFLRYLGAHLSDGPSLFFELFDHNPTERVLRFLNEQSSFAEDLRIMQSLGPLRMGPAALRQRSFLEPLA